MVQFGELSDEEFTNALSKFPSVYVWANRPREAGEVIFPPLPEGKFRTIVVDPPWPVEKILGRTNVAGRRTRLHDNKN
jgi:hypothetical protein